MKRRMTNNKRHILKALRPIPFNEIHEPVDPEKPGGWWKGQAPYMAAQVARNTGLDRSGVHRTLRGLLK